MGSGARVESLVALFGAGSVSEEVVAWGAALKMTCLSLWLISRTVLSNLKQRCHLSMASAKRRPMEPSMPVSVLGSAISLWRYRADHLAAILGIHIVRRLPAHIHHLLPASCLGTRTVTQPLGPSG